MEVTPVLFEKQNRSDQVATEQEETLVPSASVEAKQVIDAISDSPDTLMWELPEEVRGQDVQFLSRADMLKWLGVANVHFAKRKTRSHVFDLKEHRGRPPEQRKWSPENTMFEALTKSLKALASSCPGLDVMVRQTMEQEGLGGEVGEVVRTLLYSSVLNPSIPSQHLPDSFLASCPEHLLEDAQKIMREHNGFTAAGQKADTFHTDVLNCRYRNFLCKTLAWFSSNTDNWYTAWKGKVEQTITNIMYDGAQDVFAYAVKGGPQCDREREHLKKLAGMSRYQCLKVIEVDNLHKLQAELLSRRGR